MASKLARKCWESGVHLNNAWEEFAPANLKAEYAGLPTFVDAWSQGLNSENPMSIISSLNDASRISLARARIEKEMKETLLTELFNGDLIATAYREFPSRSQAPVRIDPEKFDNDDPDWNSETFDVDGIRYGRIKISRPDNLQKTVIDERRKGSIEAIDLAITQLKFKNQDFCEIPRKQACQMVRDFLGADQTNGNGLSDKNIAKAIIRNCGKREIAPNYN